jgi:hypothetical protein
MKAIDASTRLRRRRSQINVTITTNLLRSASSSFAFDSTPWSGPPHRTAPIARGEHAEECQQTVIRR